MFELLIPDRRNTTYFNTVGEICEGISSQIRVITYAIEAILQKRDPIAPSNAVTYRSPRVLTEVGTKSPALAKG